MDNPVNRDDQQHNPGQADGNNGPTNNTQNNAPTNWFEEVLFFIIAGLAFIFWEPTKWLFRGTYQHKNSSGKYDEPNTLNIVIGVLVSLAVGIGVGHQLGWVGDAGFWTWSLWGVGSAAAMFVYGWTALYRLAVRFAFTASEKLWSHVNLDAKEPYRSRYSDDEAEQPKGNPAWFSKFLMFVGWVVVVALGASVFWNVMGYVSASTGWIWIGWIAVALVALSILGGSFKLSGGFGMFVLIVGAVLSWIFWGSLTAFVAWATGAIVGLIAGGIVGAIAGVLLYNLRIPLIAALTGLATTFALAPYTTQLVVQIPLGPFDVIAPAISWLGHGAVLLFTVGFAFPIVHIFCTHVLKRLANILDLMEDVYQESRGGYREFFLHVLNIAVALTVLWFAPAVVTAALGFTAWYAVWGVALLVALVVYMVGYPILNATGVWPLGVATSAAVGYLVHGYWSGHELWFGNVGSIGSGIASGVLTFVVGFPAVYLGVRWLTQSWLSPFLRDRLMSLHKGVIDFVENIWDNLFEAAGKAYDDKTPYREIFLHVTNILVALAVAGGIVWGGIYLGIALWLPIVTAVVLGFVSYVLVGKLLVKTGAGLPGFLVGAGAGVLFGTFVFGAQPELWGNGRWILAVIGGLFGAALTFGALFPWAYLIVRAIVNVVSPEEWLRPLLVNAHDKVWLRVSTFWERFLVKYRAFQARFRQARERFAASYARFQERFKNRGK